MTKISAVINIKNEEQYLEACLKSLNFVDEIVVVDMESTDRSRDIAHQYTHHVYTHPPMDCVEKARNFALAKTTGNWILVVDPDETVPKPLAAKLIEISDQSEMDFVRLPRKNIIFGDWIKHSRWWPDYNVRFFKKGAVEWQEAIHSIPITYGNGLTLEAVEDLSLEHHHYHSIEQYLTRALRYSEVQAKELEKEGYHFNFIDALEKPFAEFLSRFFAGEGYKDGFHGFVLANLQAFSVFLVYLKIWQKQGFDQQSGNQFTQTWKTFINNKIKEFTFWQYSFLLQSTKSKSLRFWLKLKRKLSL
jgi:(heptosyl)LPS beta-1,4-glucosyltransferase